MTNVQPIRVKTITEYHRLAGLPKPEHPLVSVVDFESFERPVSYEPISLIFDFYSVSLKRNLAAKFKYGQQTYDFDEGVMFFMSPGQVFGVEFDKAATQKPAGWMILVHPDFLWNTSLAKTIKRYEYFGYSANEALYLSDKEESVITGIARNMKHEYYANIDKFSQSVIVAQLELLLTYADRFYQRQFITRKIANHQILNRLENVLTEHFNDAARMKKGLPSVQYIADTLNISPNYLSGLLKTLTGQSTQQHIHDKLIEKAKEKLSATDLTVGEIAYQLGFEHSQSFSKLFKSKTSFSPLKFRRSFD